MDDERAAPAGWYSDDADRESMRWWDGSCAWVVVGISVLVGLSSWIIGDLLNRPVHLHPR